MLGLSPSSQSQIWYISLLVLVWTCTVEGRSVTEYKCGPLVGIDITINGFMLSRQHSQCLATMVLNYIHVCAVIWSVSGSHPIAAMNII